MNIQNITPKYNINSNMFNNTNNVSELTYKNNQVGFGSKPDSKVFKPITPDNFK